MCQVKSLLLLVLALGTSACSSRDTFAILNNAKTPLTLTYTFKPRLDNISLSEQLHLIATVASDKAGEVDCSWASLSPTQYSYDQEMRKVSVQIPQATAVRIAKLSNYRETSEWAADQFPIAAITIEGAQGIIRFEEGQARKQFKNLKRSLHAVDYR